MLFEKIIAFTDIHFGLKSNAISHNKDCLDFIDWMIAKAKKEGITQCVFGGDWHHHRQSLNVETLHYSIEGLLKLNAAFEKVYFIVGNHDLYFRDNRDITSLFVARELDNIILINEKKVEGDVTFYPWLVGKEWKEVKKNKSKYVFGHFELPQFYLNAMVKMPDHGELNHGDFQSNYVFSGHFHKRQNKDNVWYIGNAFPHDFNDVWDDDRGVMILDWDGEPRFEAWPDAPKYRTYNYSAIRGNEDKHFKGVSKITAKIEYNDSDQTQSEISAYRDFLMDTYDFRVIKLIEASKQELFEGEEVEDAASCDNVDKIVVSQIQSIDSKEYNVNKLIDLYNNL